MRQDDIEQWLHPGFELALHRDEIEGYYLNVSSGSPRVFVLWRMEDGAAALPLQVTASYDEGGRWLDGGQFGGQRGDAAGDLRLDRRVRGERITGPSRRSASSRAPSSIPKDRVGR